MDDQEYQTSKFNAGILQMQRIHTLQDTINKAKLNPLASNEETGVYNYDIIISCITSLYQECCPKIKKKEDRQDIETVKDELERWMQETPFIKQTKNKEGTPKTKFDKASWKYFNKLLFKYENEVRKLIEKVGMNSPPEDESALF